MAEDREATKKTIVRTDQSEVKEIRATEETRIYSAQNDAVARDELRRTARHTWIGEEDAARTIVRDTDRKTRMAGTSAETKVVRRADAGNEEKPGGDGKEKAAAALAKAKEILSKLLAEIKLGISDLRKVRVADKGKFARFAKIVGVFLLIFILELGYFRFESHVKKMPNEIKETQKELKLTQKENALLEEEIATLGDYDSVEELKASWERLKDKVDKAAAGTYY